MKLIALLPLFSYVLVAQVAGQKVLRSKEGSSLSKEEALILKEAPMDRKEALLSKYGIEVKGSAKGLEEVDIEVEEEESNEVQKQEMSKGSSEKITLEIEENGVVISPDQTFKSVGPNETLLKEAKLPDFLYARWRCPSRPGFGYANDSVLTVRLFGFRFRFTCRERCCARQWQCSGNTCTLSCGRFTYRVRTNGFVCCSISGRTVDPFPLGRCATRFLCAA
jgi:hypothetical protein